MHELIHEFLQSIGEDPTREGLNNTPERWIKAMKELTGGYGKNLQTIINDAYEPAPSHDLILIRDIAFTSICEHHLLPFIGKIHVAYLPNKQIIGLSKIPRIVELFAQRLQTQERLGSEIVGAIKEVLDPKGVGVVIEATHLCMMTRGVRKEQATVVTEHMRGGLKRSDFPL